MSGNKMKLVILLGMYTIASLSALYLLKRGMADVKSEDLKVFASTIVNWRVLLGAVLYGTSFLLWLLLLKSYQLSSIYAIVAGVSILATTLLGVLALNESLEALKILGAVLVTAGIVLLSRYS